AGWTSRDFASPESGGKDGKECQDSDVSHDAPVWFPREDAIYARRRRLAARSFRRAVWQQYEQQQRAQSFSPAKSRDRRRVGTPERKSALEIRGSHADDEPASECAR